jgi:hypothetical protein
MSLGLKKCRPADRDGMNIADERFLLVRMTYACFLTMR